MAFTLDVSTTRGRVRLLIGDTDTVTAANQIFTDAEIDAFLALDAEVYGAAALAMRAMAASAARCAVAYKLLGNNIDIDRRDIAKRFMEIAKSYMDERDSGGGFALVPIAWAVNQAGIDETDYDDTYDEQDPYNVDSFEMHGDV